MLIVPVYFPCGKAAHATCEMCLISNILNVNLKFGMERTVQSAVRPVGSAGPDLPWFIVHSSLTSYLPTFQRILIPRKSTLDLSWCLRRLQCGKFHFQFNFSWFMEIRTHAFHLLEVTASLMIRFKGILRDTVGLEWTFRTT